MRLFAFMVCAAGVATNAYFYATEPNPWSVAGMVYCGALAVYNLVMEATDR